MRLHGQLFGGAPLRVDKQPGQLMLMFPCKNLAPNSRLYILVLVPYIGELSSRKEYMHQTIISMM